MLDQWVLDILADPLTKLSTTPSSIGLTDGFVDARRYLPNTIGFDVWLLGQSAYETWNKQTP